MVPKRRVAGWDRRPSTRRNGPGIVESTRRWSEAADPLRRPGPPKGGRKGRGEWVASCGRRTRGQPPPEARAPPTAPSSRAGFLACRGLPQELRQVGFRFVYVVAAHLPIAPYAASSGGAGPNTSAASSTVGQTFTLAVAFVVPRSFSTGPSRAATRGWSRSPTRIRRWSRCWPIPTA